MKNVQMILNKEAKLVKELEAVKAQKEQIAINALADATEVLKALGCEYLLNSKVITERPVNISIKKGKIVKINKEVKVEVPVVKEVIKEVVKEVKDTTEINKLKAEIEKLKKTVATYQRKETEYKKEIEELKTQLESEPVVETIVSDIDLNDDGYLEFLATQEGELVEEEEIEEEIITVIEKQNKEVVIDKPKFVKESPARFSNNPKARIYQTEKCYLIASPTTKEITWMTNETLTNEYKEEVENILVRDYKFSINRQELSPVTVHKNNGYMARTAAVEGFQNFSSKDLLCGYVKLDNSFYLYTYVPGAPKPYVDSLDKKIVNAKYTKPSAEIISRVMYVVNGMYQEYRAQVNSIVNSEKEQAQKAADEFNANQEAIRKQREIDEAIIAASGIKLENNKKKEGDKSNKPKVLSASLAALADEF